MHSVFARCLVHTRDSIYVGGMNAQCIDCGLAGQGHTAGLGKSQGQELLPAPAREPTLDGGSSIFQQGQPGDVLCVFVPRRVSLPVLPPRLPVCKAKIHVQQEISIGCYLLSPAFTFAALKISCPLHITQIGNVSFGFDSGSRPPTAAVDFSRII